MELLPGLSDTLSIVGVDDEDESLGVLEVVPPEGADLVLTAHVPHGEADVLVLHRLYVETCNTLFDELVHGGEVVGLTDGGDGGDDLSELELVEDGGLSGGVQSDHEDAHLLLAEEARKHRGHGQTHGGRICCNEFFF